MPTTSISPAATTIWRCIVTASTIGPDTPQRLDHIGFVVNEIGDVDTWFAFLRLKGVTILKEPRTHRDGARSFYCQDPAGNTVQMIYHPPLANK